MKFKITPLQPLWVVTKPRPRSVLVDICFETDLQGLENQFKGGLAAADIHAIYTDRHEAVTAAEVLLQKRDNQ